jgi:hypothetical protein
MPEPSGVPRVADDREAGTVPGWTAGDQRRILSEPSPARGQGGDSASYRGQVKSSEAETLINARGSTVWMVLTDAGNLTVWDSGITDIVGDIRNGSTIRVRIQGSDGRSVRLRVQQVPGQVMLWVSGLPLGLRTRVRTFVLTPHGALTRLQVKEEVSGPLLRFTQEARPASEQSLGAFAEAVRSRAELLERHF